MGKMIRSPITLAVLLVVALALGAWRWQSYQRGQEMALRQNLDNLGKQIMGVRVTDPAGIARFGEQAVAPLIQALQDPHANALAQQQAAEALGLIGSPRAIPALVQTARRGAEAARKEAVKALGRIAAPEAVQALIELLDTPAVRALAITELGERKAAEARPKLLEWLEGQDLAAAQAAAVALGRIGGEGVSQRLTAHLKEPALRLACATGLATLGEKQGTQVLVELLGDPKEANRIGAAAALGALGTQATALVLPVLQDRRREVRLAAITALGALKDPQAVPALIPFLKDKSPDLRIATATALGRIGGTEAQAALLRELGTGTAAVNAAVEKALSQFGPALIPQLASALKSPETRRRVAAARVLSTIPDAASVEPLIQALQDREAAVRLEAARGLGRVGDQRAIVPLEQAQQDPDEAVGKMARTSSRMMNTRFGSD
jgi:HEAT repeat protein